MIIFIECVICCIIFTLMVLLMAKDPIKTLYNYPPKIQEKVRSLPQYKDKIPTTKNKVVAKVIASLLIVIIVSMILKYINGYSTFCEAFKSSLIIWTVINIYDVIVLDILWFCQSPKFVFKGTEDLENEYKNYWFHIKQGFIGEFIGLGLCIIISLIVGVL